MTFSNWDSVVGQYFADAAVQPETYSPTKTWTESLKGTDGFAVVIDNLSTILTYFETNTTYASLFKTSLLQMIFNNSDLLTAAQKTTAMQALYPAMTGATIN